MDWVQKLLALQALVGVFNTSLKIRPDKSWYVNLQGLERKEGGCLSIGCQAAPSPEAAVEECWKWATDPEFYLVVGAYSDERRAVRWNGFMWEDVKERV